MGTPLPGEQGHGIEGSAPGMADTGIRVTRSGVTRAYGRKP